MSYVSCNRLWIFLLPWVHAAGSPIMVTFPEKTEESYDLANDFF
jgi:hypothetical protein